jgi:hypothetical protein
VRSDRLLPLIEGLQETPVVRREHVRRAAPPTAHSNNIMTRTPHTGRRARKWLLDGERESGLGFRIEPLRSIMHGVGGTLVEMTRDYSHRRLSGRPCVRCRSRSVVSGECLACGSTQSSEEKEVR